MFENPEYNPNRLDPSHKDFDEELARTINRRWETVKNYDVFKSEAPLCVTSGTVLPMPPLLTQRLLHGFSQKSIIDFIGVSPNFGFPKTNITHQFVLNKMRSGGGGKFIFHFDDFELYPRMVLKPSGIGLEEIPETLPRVSNLAQTIRELSGVRSKSEGVPSGGFR